MFYDYSPPKESEVPILISVPHSGTEFPIPENGLFNEKSVTCPIDTDWFVHDLYDWAPQMGIGVVRACLSRYVIDLNRDPNGASLYSDGRRETSLCPAVSFSGDNLYKNESPDIDIAGRKQSYFDPYHDFLKTELARRREIFGVALLWDAHSIRRRVPSIQPDPFPDLILGSNEGMSCDQQIEETVWKALNTSGFSVTRNHPFKGGFITRSFGQPKRGMHALQLEMSQDVYMDEASMKWNEGKAEPVKNHLKKVMLAIIGKLDP